MKVPKAGEKVKDFCLDSVDSATTRVCIRTNDANPNHTVQESNMHC